MDIVGPPYPADGCTIRSFIHTIGYFYDWIMEHEEFAIQANEQYELGLKFNFELGKRPTVANDENRLLACPIGFIFGNWKLLRLFRETYDQVVRDYEHDWDSAKCVAIRASGVFAAINLYATIFDTYETFETKMQKKQAISRSDNGLFTFLSIFDKLNQKQSGLTAEEYRKMKEDTDDLF